MALTLPLSAHTRAAFSRQAQDLSRVFGDRCLSVVASGVHSSIAFVTTIDAGDLDALAPLAQAWHSDGIDSPLLLTPAEFRRSLDTFPLEYGAVLRRHVVITGTPPFEDAAVDSRHVRRACEVLAKAHLIHLRQGWIDASGHHEDLAALLFHSTEPLRALLGHVALLHPAAHDDDDSALAGARLAGLDLELVGQVLDLEREPDRAHRLVGRLPEYLELARHLWTFVDQWES